MGNETFICPECGKELKAEMCPNDECDELCPYCLGDSFVAECKECGVKGRLETEEEKEKRENQFMKEVPFDTIEEKETYIVESVVTESRPKGFSPTTEFDSNFEFERQQLVTILKIEFPYFVIKGRHGRDFVKLSADYKYLKPSKEFLEALKSSGEFEY